MHALKQNGMSRWRIDPSSVKENAFNPRCVLRSDADPSDPGHLSEARCLNEYCFRPGVQCCFDGWYFNTTNPLDVNALGKCYQNTLAFSSIDKQCNWNVFDPVTGWRRVPPAASESGKWECCVDHVATAPSQDPVINQHAFSYCQCDNGAWLPYDAHTKPTCYTGATSKSGLCLLNAPDKC